MKKTIYLLFSVLLLSSCQEEKHQKLTIATAANMQYVIKALQQSFTEETGIACEIIIGSSGKLTAQIIQGAPFDVFLSADMKYPETLFEKQLTIGAPKAYAYGNLILWSVAEEVEPSFDLLTEKSIKHIAIANPKTAPYGRAAMEALEHYGLLDSIKNKLVYGESIAQTNQFITTKSAVIGFTAKSTPIASNLSDQGKWLEIPSDAHRPIAQGIVLLKATKLPVAQAQKFYDFLFSAKGKEILNNFGYSVDN